MKKTAVIFDMDGLMFDTERLSFEAQQLAAENFPVKFSFDYELFLTQIGKSEKAIHKEFTEIFGDGSLAEKFIQDTNTFQKEIVLTKGLPQKKGLINALTFLKNKAVPCAVASSSYREQVEFYLELAGLTDYFQFFVCGDEVSQSKPHPEIFLKAWEQFQIDKEECLILEDSLNGIRSASAAGIDVLMVPDIIPPNQETHEKAVYIADDLDEVVDWLKQKQYIH